MAYVVQRKVPESWFWLQCWPITGQRQDRTHRCILQAFYQHVERHDNDLTIALSPKYLLTDVTCSSWYQGVPPFLSSQFSITGRHMRRCSTLAWHPAVSMSAETSISMADWDDGLTGGPLPKLHFFISYATLRPVADLHIYRQKVWKVLKFCRPF